MTTFFIITSIVLGTLVLAGLKDSKTQRTAFSVSRDKVNHFHYQEYKYEKRQTQEHSHPYWKG